MNKMHKKFAACLLAASMILSAALPAESAEAKTKTPTVSTKKVTVQVKGSKTVKVRKNRAKVKKVTWKSKNKKIAKVKKGKITGVKPGKTKINCKITYKKRKKTKTVTVKISVTVKKKKAATEAPSKPTAPPSSTKKPGTPSPSETPAAPTFAPTEAPDDPSVVPAQKFAKSFKGMDANNPLLANSFACDPTAIEYNGRVYVYMTNDSQEHAGQGDQGDNKYGFITSVHIISSDDMVNWTDHGICNIGGKEGINSYTGCCWAPCVAYKKIDGKDKFFLYYTNGGYQIGVAVADSPIGPFRDEKKAALLGPQTANTSDADALDPAVFTDSDGKSYLVWGGDCGRSPEEKHYPRIRQLADDMLSFTGEEVLIEAPYFFEDAGINKIGDKYYFSYCSDWYERSGACKDLSLCSIAYMVADSPMGPYTYTGEVLPNCGNVFKDANGEGVWANNHHSIMQFQNECYMFYHTMTLQTEMGIHFGGRSTHVNKLQVNADGTLGLIQQDYAGVPQLKNFDPYQNVSGLVSSNNAGMNSIRSTVVTRIKGDKEVTDYVIPEEGARMEAVKSKKDYQYSWLSIKGADFGDTSPSTFQATLKGYYKGTVNLRICADDLDGTEIINTKVTFDEYGDASISVPSGTITGKHDLYIEFDGSVRDFVSWQFKQ